MNVFFYSSVLIAPSPFRPFEKEPSDTGQEKKVENKGVEPLTS